MAEPGRYADADEDELAARAAWFHYAGGLTQSAVAKRLGLQPTRAHRLITRATRDGLVRITVDCEVAACIALEELLAERYHLNRCQVVPDLGEDQPMPLKALGQGGSRFLRSIVDQRRHALIALGHGRTLSAVVDALPGRGMDRAAYVSLLGGLNRKFAANPYDVIFRLADKASAEAYFMPAPMFVDSEQDRHLMLGQTGLAEVMRQIESATICVLGIGSTHAKDTLALGAPGDDKAAARLLRKAGAVAELLGQFLDADGALVSTPYDRRMMAPELDTLAGKEVVAIAGGEYKHGAIQAALRSGRLTGLITDEVTARHLVGQGSLNSCRGTSQGSPG